MVYFLSNQQYIKIGYTKFQDVNKRIKQLSTGSSNSLLLLGTVDGNKKTEKKLHILFFRDKKNLEWFKPENIINWLNENNQLNYYCEIENGVIKRYEKMKK